VCTSAGSCTTTISSNVTSGGSNTDGTGAGSTTSAGDGKVVTGSASEFCKAKPNDKQCQGISQGVAAGTGDLYGAGERTVADVLSEFKAAVSAAPIVSAATGYLSTTIPAGTCSGLAVSVDVMGHTWSFDPGSVLCGTFAASVYAVLGIGVMLAAGWVAFRIAIL